MKLIFGGIVFVTLFIIAFPGNVYGQWVESNEGLYGGPVTLFLEYNDTIYAGTYGGVFRSLDAGTSWDRINDGISNVASVNDIIECGGEIFLATNGGYRLYKLNNNKSGWIPFNDGLPTFAITGLVSISDILIGVTNQGTLYKSTDLAVSWQEITTSPGVISSIASTGSELVAGTSNGIYVSLDFGQTWVEKSSGLTNKIIYFVDGVSNNLICWTSGGVFFSDNAASSWKSTGFLQDYYHLSNKGSAIIARSFRASYISNNGGASWSNLNQVPMGIGSIFIDEGILAGTEYGIYRSTDGGSAWSSSNAGLKNNTAYAFAETNGFLFIAAHNGVYRSADNGQTWSASGIGLPVGTVWSLTVQGDVLLAGFNKEGIYASSNGGNSWIKVSNVSGVRRFVPFKDRLLAGAVNGLYESVDGGLSWNLFTSNLQYITDMVTNGSRLWVCSSTGVNYTDNGTTWINANEGLPSLTTIPYSLFSFSGNLLLGTINSSIYASYNTVEPWNYSGYGIFTNQIKSFSSIDTVLLAGGAGGVYITLDSGANWSPMNEGLPVYYQSNTVESLHIQKRKLFTSTNSLGVWAWSPCLMPATPIITESNETCRDVLFTSNADTGNIWYVDGVAIPGANEKELRPISQGEYSLRVIVEGCPSNFSEAVQFMLIPELSVEMPNVFTPNGDALNELFMPIKVEGVRSSELQIYNRWGKRVYTSYNLEKGWNGGENPSGTYYYSIFVNDLCGKSKTINGWVQLIR